MIRKETGLTKQDKALDQVRRLLEDWDNRLVLHDLNVAKRYIERNLNIVINFRLRPFPEQYHAFVKSVPPGRRDGEWAFLNMDMVSDHTVAEMPHYHKSLVFINFCKFMENPKGFSFPSLVGFKRVDESDGVRGKLLYFFLGRALFEFISAPGGWKKCTSPAFPVGDGEGASQMIQGVPEIRDYISSDLLDVRRQSLSEADLHQYFSAFRIDLFSDFVWPRIREGVDCHIEVLDVALGPFNL